MAAARELSTSEQGKAVLASVDADLDKFSGQFEQASNLVATGRTMPALVLNRDVAAQIGTHMEKSAEEYINLQKAQLAEAEASAAALTTSSRWTTLIFVTIGLAVVGLITFTVSK